MGVPKNLLGMRFGKLTVIALTDERSCGSVVWLCQCDCGNTAKITSSNLRSDNTKSCGCLQGGGYSKEFNGLYRRHANNTQKRGLEMSLSKDEYYDLITQNCAYCGASPSNVYTYTGKNKRGERTGGTLVYTGIDRVDNSKGYIPGNCVPCCKHCNQIKSDQALAEFSDWIMRVYHNLQKGIIPQ